MSLEIQFKLKNNQNYLRYIRENSIWYKLLNRDPTLFPKFEEEVKERYQLRTTDKISKALETFDFLQKFLTNLK